jgi:hypothetical protein
MKEDFELTNENEDQDNSIEEIVAEVPDERTLLKQRADIMGIVYHPNIGTDKLKAKIQEKLDTPVDKLKSISKDELETIEAAEAGDVFTQEKALTPTQIAMALRKECLKLVRIRVTNMNPLNANRKGDIFSVGNSQIGFIKKFVPYNSDVGYHVPQILLTQMQSKKFMTHYEVQVGNKKVKRHRLIPELAIEILPPLTTKELQELKQRQLMAGGLGE